MRLVMLVRCPLTQHGGAMSKMDMKSGKPAQSPALFLRSCVPLSISPRRALNSSPVKWTRRAYLVGLLGF